ncbi:MAG: DNA primase [Actinomycetota bacterium]
MQGRILTEDIEELRDRTDIVEVISAHMKLKKAGRVFKGLCCFHQEKTSSFTVDPAKQLFHCFGCGKGGDVFSFLRDTEGLGFAESAERLADRIGMTLRYEGGNTSGARFGLLEATAQAAAYFSELLTTSAEAEVARKYLEERGFSADDATAWGLGFAPRGGDVLYRHLLTQKLSSKQIVDAGLALITESGQHRDRFRGRLVFPVNDLSGHVIGFGARTLGDDQPKYLNSPETDIYHKSKILFGLDRARESMVRDGVAIVTEGYTDVIGLAKVGVVNAVATCGTALGEEHFALIKRFCERVILAFDSDAAGAMASERGFGIHAKVGLEVLVAPLPAGRDPADIALMEGADAVRAVLDQARPLMRFVLEREIDRHSLDTAEGKAQAVKAAVAMLELEPRPIAKGDHAAWVAQRIGVDHRQVQQDAADARAPRSVDRPAASRQPGYVKVEREALTILMDSPSLLSETAEWLTDDHFTQPEHQALYRSMREGSVPEGSSRIALTPVATQDHEEVFLRLEEFRLRRQIDSLRAKLDSLDPKVDVASFDETFAELMRLDELRRRFDDR